MKTLDELAGSFREEAAERIAELEATLLELESRPLDGDLVDRAFRALHTIKGSGAMFGFDALAAFTHEIEAVFDEIRNGRLSVTRDLIGLALEAKDQIRAMLDGPADEGAAVRERLVASLRQLSPAPDAPDAQARPATPAEAGRPARYRVRFRPRVDLFQNGTDPLILLAELQTLGPCEIVADTTAVPLLEALDPESCFLGWECVVTTDRDENALRDVFIFVEDRCELSVERLGGDPQAGIPAEASPLAASAERVAERAGAGERTAPEQASSVRVAAGKLDKLVDLVGELVIAQARLIRLATRRDDPELLSISEEIDRLASELRSSTLDVRMVPIGTTFGRFRRVTRDLAAELGKDIDLVTAGAETEIDKTVIERLGDPLVHIIRNSCDHGIESPDVRRAAGKPPRGTIRLSAFQSGPSVVVEIRDDGAGLDTARIRARAEERGLVERDAKLTDKELFGLVFLPGFSTAREVSSVSGRGVGMDVVKRSIEALRGSVRLESAPGAGTTIRIELPLTLAIIEGLLVTVGDGSYVLPLSAVEECVELTADDIQRMHGARLAVIRGELVPYLRLRELFDIAGDRPEIEQIAIVRSDGVRHGLVVDHVVGQHQTVIKSLGRMYRGLRGLSGATILGDGAVALIVDVPAMIQQAGLAHGIQPPELKQHPEYVA